ncbi:hypothetical protein J6590_055352 [Homalodisca vitripennis]|nr:hypothetical protein J6590_055352 [Homalodisca vitripennis]
MILLVRAISSVDMIPSNKFMSWARPRPHLEYCCTVWSPHQEYLIGDMDRTQRRFLHLVGLKLWFGYRDAPLNDIAALLGLLGLGTLDARRMAQDMAFSSCIEF